MNSKAVKFSLQKVSRVLIKHCKHRQSGLQVVPDPLLFSYPMLYHGGLPGVSESKESACNAGDLGLENPLEKGMAIHSSILAWKIPWTEEPGRLQSMGS